MRSAAMLLPCLLALACSAPLDERSTEDGSVAHPRCESCHVADFEAADDPPHSGELPSTCFVCHSQRAWAPAHLAHDFYPLTGAHLGARCFGCHIVRMGDNEPRFEGTDGECVDCHRGDYDRSEFPGHSRFPLTCAECHSTSAWSPSLHPPPDAWVDVDAGTPFGDLLDGIGSASGRGGSGPYGPIGDIGNIGTLETLLAPDAGTVRRPVHHRRHPPPPTTTIDTPPPPTTTIDIGTSASRHWDGRMDAPLPH